MVTFIVQGTISGGTVHTSYNASGKIVTSYIGKNMLHPYSFKLVPFPRYLTSVFIVFYSHFFILTLQISPSFLFGISLLYSFLWTTHCLWLVAYFPHIALPPVLLLNKDRLIFLHSLFSVSYIVKKIPCSS